MNVRTRHAQQILPSVFTAFCMYFLITHMVFCILTREANVTQFPRATNSFQVVQRIKAVTNETRLLVVDPEADAWYQARGVVVRGDQANVVRGSSQRANGGAPTPAPDQDQDQDQEDHDRKSVGSSSSCRSEASSHAQVGAGRGLHGGLALRGLRASGWGGSPRAGEDASLGPRRTRLQAINGVSFSSF